MRIDKVILIVSAMLIAVGTSPFTKDATLRVNLKTRAFVKNIIRRVADYKPGEIPVQKSWRV